MYREKRRDGQGKGRKKRKKEERGVVVYLVKDREFLDRRRKE